MTIRLQDYKDWIQNKAEELTLRGFLLTEIGLITWEDKDFYELPEIIRDRLYQKATNVYKDAYANSIDTLGVRDIGK